jgi:hypothetical protein
VRNAPDEIIREILALEEAHKTHSIRERAQRRFHGFVKHVYEGFIEGAHHRKVATQYEKLAMNPGSRVIINMPPRHTKSEFASYMLPAWLIGKNPKLKIIQTTHTAELAVRFGRKVRNLMDMKEYKEVFPDVELSADSKAAGRWETGRAVSIMRLVWAVRLRVAVLTFSLLMTRIRSRMPFRRRRSNTPTSGTLLGPVSVYNRVGLL